MLGKESEIEKTSRVEIVFEQTSGTMCRYAIQTTDQQDLQMSPMGSIRWYGMKIGSKNK